MYYVIAYGGTYLADHGTGWTKWTTTLEDAEVFPLRTEAAGVAVEVGGEARPYMTESECGAV